jgi:hypothetical protein
MEEKKEETLDERKARLYKEVVENNPAQKNFDKQVAGFKQRNYQREISDEHVVIEEKEEKKEEEIKYTAEDLAAMNTHIHDEFRYITNEISEINQTLRRIEKIVKYTYRIHIETAEALKEIWHWLLIDQVANPYAVERDELAAFKKIIEENKEQKAEIAKEENQED